MAKGRGPTVKVILSAPMPSAGSLQLANLAAVAAGTLKVLFWFGVVPLIAVAAMIAGMMQASRRYSRRHW